MGKILHKLFGFKHIGYVAVEHIYYHETNPYKGYELCYKYKFLWLDCYDRIAICCDKEHLQQELDIRGITLINKS